MLLPLREHQLGEEEAGTDHVRVDGGEDGLVLDLHGDELDVEDGLVLEVPPEEDDLLLCLVACLEVSEFAEASFGLKV